MSDDRASARKHTADNSANLDFNYALTELRRCNDLAKATERTVSVVYCMATAGSEVDNAFKNFFFRAHTESEVQKLDEPCSSDVLRVQSSVCTCWWRECTSQGSSRSK
jgi:hypothetical protein